ncbi:MAG: aminotransferase class IV [Candidatus Humimicrobiaceae bacterium]
MVENKNNFIIINGNITPENKAFISVNNSGFLYGDGLFETIKVHNGKIFLFEEHISRLYLSLCFFNYQTAELKDFKNEIKKNIDELIQIKNLTVKDALVKIVVCRGEYKKRLDYMSAQKSSIIIFAEEFKGYPVTYYTKGVDVVISSIKRVSYQNVLYRHKGLAYFENIFSRNEAISKGANESLFVSVDDFILEGSVSNIFMIKKETVFTPSLDFNILAGITREKVLKICSDNNVKVKEEKLKLKDLYEADEIFITNSMIGILPVKKIENYTLRKEVPGSITKKISFLYQKEFK